MKKIVGVVLGFVFALLVAGVLTSPAFERGSLAAEEGAAPVVVPVAPEPAQEALVKLVPDDAVLFENCLGLDKIWASMAQSNFWKQFVGLKLWDETGIRAKLAEWKKEFAANVGVEVNTENIMSFMGKEVVVALFVEPASPLKPASLMKPAVPARPAPPTELAPPAELPAPEKPAGPVELEKEKGESEEQPPAPALEPGKPEAEGAQPPASEKPAVEEPAPEEPTAEEEAAEKPTLEKAATEEAGLEKEALETEELEKPGEAPKIGVLLLCRTNPKEKAQAAINKLAEFLKKEAREDVEFKETSHDGTKITTIRSGDEPVQVQYGFIGDVFALSVGTASPKLESVLDLSKGKGNSIVDHPQFKKTLDATRMTTGRYAGCFYADIEKLGGIFAALTKADIPLMLQPMVYGMQQSFSAPVVVGGSTYLDRGLVVKMVSFPTGIVNDELIQLSLGTPPAAGTNIKYVPENAIAYVGANSMPDMQKLWPVLLQQWEKQGAMAPMSMILGSVETALGIKIAEDVIPWLGSEVAGLFTDIDTKPGFPYPQFALMVKIKDKQKANAFVAKLNKLSKELSEQKGLKSETVVHEGCTLNSLSLVIPIAVPIAFSPGYGIVDDFFVVGMSTDVLKQLIDTSKGRVKGLASNAAYKSLNLPPETGATFFFNWRRLMDVAKAVAAWVVEFTKAQPTVAPETAASVKAVVDNHVVPLLNCLSALECIGGYQVNDGEMSAATYYIRVKDLPARQ